MNKIKFLAAAALLTACGSPNKKSYSLSPTAQSNASAYQSGVEDGKLKTPEVPKEDWKCMQSNLNPDEVAFCFLDQRRCDAAVETMKDIRGGVSSCTSRKAAVCYGFAYEGEWDMRCTPTYKICEGVREALSPNWDAATPCRIFYEKEKSASPDSYAPLVAKSKPAPPPPPPKPYVPEAWSCSVDSEDRSVSRCHGSVASCDRLRSSMIADGYPTDSCYYQEVAACYDYRDLLDGKDYTHCATSLSSCDFLRGYRDKEDKRDSKVLTQCKPLKWSDRYD